MSSSKKNKTTLVTGCAGFIGFHLTIKLLDQNQTVIGIDNLNNYYDKSLKKNRLKEIIKHSKKNKKKFIFFKYDINDKNNISKLFKRFKFNNVFHLAAQAGVRNSIKNPYDYFSTNLFGFCNILDNCKTFKTNHLIFASSSSVYGGEKKLPYKESGSSVDHPIQLYAATKRSNEILAHSYSHLYRMKITALRFFTVYGPWGRPDMAIFKFTKKILENKSIEIYNRGDHYRDFTYIDDIVNGIVRSSKRKNNKKIKLNTNLEILNIGCGSPSKLMNCINLIEKNLGKVAKKKFLDIQKGDMHKTFASTKKIKKLLNYETSINLKEGIKRFVLWYKKYYYKK
jgi:UDP-glucuronate 4-epimerase